MPSHDSAPGLDDLRDARVHFRISDVRVPDAGELLARLHGADLLQGRVADLTDSGTNSETFAIVEVDDLDQPVIVPTRCLNHLPITCPPP